MKVLVAMSGGVDSSVAAKLLRDAGCECVGCTMKLFQNVPVLGIVENMSYFQCDECGKKHEIFGRSHLDEIAAQCEIPRTARMPLNPALAAACDAGKIEMFDGDWLDELAGEIAAL